MLAFPAGMRVLVTGHNGYIGSVLCPLLQTVGHEVLGLDTFFFQDCTIGMARDHRPAVRKDLRDVEPADLRGVDAIIHLAALSDDPRSEGAERTDQINHLGAVRLARSARDAGVGRFLFASSCSVYGTGGDDPLGEDAPLRPTTAYAVSKARAEEDIARLADGDFSPAFLRSATVYGVSPRLRADTLFNGLVCGAHSTGRIRTTGDPMAWRPMVHVQDVAAVYAAALGVARDVIHGQAFNMGYSGENYRLSELAEIVRGAVPGSAIEHEATADPDPRACRLDFGKLSRALPTFRPQWNAAFGAKDLYAALQEAGVTLEDLQGRKYIRLAQLRYLLASEQVDEHLRWVPSAIYGTCG